MYNWRSHPRVALSISVVVATVVAVSVYQSQDHAELVGLRYRAKVGNEERIYQESPYLQQSWRLEL